MRGEGGGFRLKLDVQGQRGGRILEVARQGGCGVSSLIPEKHFFLRF